MKTLDEALAHHSSGSEDGDGDAFHALFLTPVIGLAYFRIPSRVMRLMNGSQALPVPHECRSALSRCPHARASFEPT